MKWLRKLAEKYAETYYEGPHPPARLSQMVVYFANLYPHATRQEWIAFAQGHAEECYRSGYSRGEEWAERDEDAQIPSGQPEAIADALDPDWRWRDSIELEGDPMAVALDINTVTEQEIHQAHLDEIYVMRLLNKM